MPSRSPAESYETIANYYLKSATESFSYHYQWYSTDTKNGLDIGWYIGEPHSYVAKQTFPGKPLPLNWQASLGRASIMITKAGNYSTNSSPYQASQRLCNYFLLEMEYQADDSFAWKIWPQMRYYPPGYVANYDYWEDYGHSYVNLEFMALCHQHVGVFYGNEMGRLANTISNRIFLNANQLRFDLRPNAITSSGLPKQYDGLYLAGYYFPYASRSAKLERLIYDALITYGTIHNSLGGYPGSYGAGGSFRSLAELIAFYKP